MHRVEYEDRSFWERKWTAEEEIEKKAQEEVSWTEGVDGEDYFDRIVLKEARGKKCSGYWLWTGRVHVIRGGTGNESGGNRLL